MATKLDIINNALINLGQPPIDSLSNPNQAIQGVIQIYEMIVRNTLVMHPWKFALKTVKLTEADSSTHPITEEYSRVYHLPGDYIYCWRTFPLNFNYRIQGKLIYTNQPTGWKMIYVFDQEPGNFPDYFSLLVSYELSARAALLMTENSELMQVWEQKAQRQLMLAQNRDSSQQPNDHIMFNPYLSFHASGWGGM